MRRPSFLARRALRAAVVAAAVAPAAKATGGDLDLVKEDVGGSTYGVPLVDEVHLASYRDFRDLVAASDWSRAFRAVAEQMENPPQGLLPAREGIALSFGERLWRDLTELDRDGRRAFRLYYDARAERLWREAERQRAPEERLELLRTLYERWFITSWGDQAGDALARAALAVGDASRAAAYWRAVVEHHRDTDLDRYELWLDLCAACAAADDREGLGAAAEHVSLRYAGREVARSGETQPVEDWLAGLVRRRRPGEVSGALPARLPLAEDAPVAWSFALPEIEASASASDRQVFFMGDQQDQNEPPLPAALLHEAGFLLDHAGELRLMDPADGSEVWTAGERTTRVAPGQLRGRGILVRAGDDVLAATDFGMNDQSLVTHLMRVEPGPGRERWTTADWVDDASFLGEPLALGDRIYVVAQGLGTYNLELWCLDRGTGEPRWNVPIGTPASTSTTNPFGWNTSTSLLPLRPALVSVAGELLVVTDSGAVLSVDPLNGGIQWAHVRPLDRRLSPGPSPGSVHVRDGVLFVRTHGSTRCVALDVVGRRELWTATVAHDERIVAADDAQLYLLGANVRALDMGSGDRVWSRPVLVPADARHLVLTEAYVYVLTRRGLYELERATGDSGRRPLRGAFRRPGGGDLFCDGRRLVCVGAEEVLAVDLVE